MKLIPAIDIINGQVVRLTEGNYASQKTYDKTPTELASYYEDCGFRFLHLVDLDGAKAGRIVNENTLSGITKKTNLIVDFGGGVTTDSEIEKAFRCGASQVTGGSIAIKNRALFSSWLSMYGSEKIILGADVRNYKIAINGWETQTTEDVFQFIESYPEIRSLICTDISKDGKLEGTSLELYAELKSAFPKCSIIASGGVASINDIYQLQKIGVDGVIIGKALLEGRIDPKVLISEVGERSLQC